MPTSAPLGPHAQAVRRDFKAICRVLYADTRGLLTTGRKKHRARNGLENLKSNLHYLLDYVVAIADKHEREAAAAAGPPPKNPG